MERIYKTKTEQLRKMIMIESKKTLIFYDFNKKYLLVDEFTCLLV